MPNQVTRLGILNTPTSELDLQIYVDEPSAQVILSPVVAKDWKKWRFLVGEIDHAQCNFRVSNPWALVRRTEVVAELQIVKSITGHLRGPEGRAGLVARRISSAKPCASRLAIPAERGN